jgi:hypothetical protein
VDKDIELLMSRAEARILTAERVPNRLKGRGSGGGTTGGVGGVLLYVLLITGPLFLPYTHVILYNVTIGALQLMGVVK